MGDCGSVGLLVRKVASVAASTAEERDALELLPMTVHSVPARQDIVLMGTG